MILDDNLEFADATSVGTPNNSTVNVGDIIDLGASPDLFANGEPMAVVVQVTTAITGTTSTVKFKVVSDATTTIATDGTASEHGSTDLIAEAVLVAGKEYVIPLVQGTTFERYLAFQVEEGSGNVLTAGNVNAFLVPLSHAGSWSSLPDAAN